MRDVERDKRAPIRHTDNPAERLSRPIIPEESFEPDERKLLRARMRNNKTSMAIEIFKASKANLRAELDTDPSQKSA